MAEVSITLVVRVRWWALPALPVAVLLARYGATQAAQSLADLVTSRGFYARKP